ncbi:MAG: hypothetical protein JST65_18865 [Acidobacteria bacterium]|nr:hypothetical protein [Acidobacteriota bacterium]
MAPPERFQRAIQGLELSAETGSWYRFAALSDGSSYASWPGVGEFLVSGDGKFIECHAHRSASSESFQVYTLGQALSFALVKQGFEPLHATVVVIDGEAVAFLGESGFGKSTMAASLLASGHRLLTDDLLILRNTAGGLLAYPGPPRIKAFPKIARKFLREESVGFRMNPDTKKLIIPLSGDQVCNSPVPLVAIYSIAAPSSAAEEDVRIEPLSPRDSFVEMVRHTFNCRIVNPARLKRHFVAYAGLVGSSGVRKLHYPRRLATIRTIHERLFEDVSSCKNHVRECVSALRGTP